MRAGQCEGCVCYQQRPLLQPHFLCAAAWRCVQSPSCSSLAQHTVHWPNAVHGCQSKKPQSGRAHTKGSRAWYEGGCGPKHNAQPVAQNQGAQQPPGRGAPAVSRRRNPRPPKTALATPSLSCALPSMRCPLRCPQPSRSCNRRGSPPAQREPTSAASGKRACHESNGVIVPSSVNRFVSGCLNHFRGAMLLQRAMLLLGCSPPISPRSGAAPARPHASARSPAWAAARQRLSRSPPRCCAQTSGSSSCPRARCPCGCSCPGCWRGGRAS